MSLILDALKKLDREKRVRSRNEVVLLSPTPWPSARSSQKLLAVALITIGLALLGAAGLIFWTRAYRSTTDSQAATPTPSAPSPAPLSNAATASRADIPAAPPPMQWTAPSPPKPAEVSPRPSPRSATSFEPVTKLRFRLNAIGMQDGQPVAVLNDRLVREGDRFDGITIIAIGDTSVEIEVNGQRALITF